MSYSLEQSRRWFARAERVIPGGIYGHTSPVVLVPGAFPSYAAEGHGCRYTDVDGNEYIDFMCGYGPVLLGHRHAEVEAAAEAARRKGTCFNHPTPLMVELAEALVGVVDFADWAVFAKNGSDLTTWCLQVAREATGRAKVFKARGAYHGTHAWCAPGHGGQIAEDRAQVAEFAWNDAGGLEELFRRHAGKVAALILTPFHHPAYGDSELPSSEFVAAANRLSREHGVLLVLDDVRCGFRLAEAGSHGVYGYEPDLAVYCKAMANGYPISAA
ncbi:MAG: aminotransferase class III-fold pyridoxal phosphate-dependent enzyme, partial [Chloroflexaceae bacterium]|nr:aminotransferase class III-fold pyridoxal phosphate-dependent enzyme [Chloroflexaceae bacterium]